jgi:hypothetical protein
MGAARHPAFPAPSHFSRAADAITRAQSRAGNADACALFDGLNLKVFCFARLRQVATPDRDLLHVQ